MTEASSELLERRVLQVCEAVGALNEYWGFKSVMGRIWTLLALRRDPMAQTEIADALGISRSLVSTTITDMVRLGLARPTGDNRNAPYEAIMDVWPVISDVLRTREWMLLESTRMALESMLEEARGARPGRYDVARAELLLAMISAIQGLLKLVVSVRGTGSPRAFTDWIKTVTRLIRDLRKL